MANLLTLHVMAADGTRTTLQARPGTNLMRAAQSAGLEGIAADCGGCLSCATCHVYIDEPWLVRLPLPSGDERAMLDMTAAERRPGSRLSCQITLDDSLDGLSVALPDTQY